MAAALQNIWHLRTVAETSAKNCMVCFRPSTSVLITPDNKDFFYICRGHLKDRGFCTPLEDPEAKRKEALRVETEKIQQEYREKIAAKEKKEKEKKKQEGKDKDNTEKKKDDDRDKENKKESDGDKDKPGSSEGATNDGQEGPATEDLPRIYSLHRNFFQMRLDRIRKAEIAKRNRERLGNPTTFPSVPTGLP